MAPISATDETLEDILNEPIITEIDPEDVDKIVTEISEEDAPALDEV